MDTQSKARLRHLLIYGIYALDIMKISKFMVHHCFIAFFINVLIAYCGLLPDCEIPEIPKISQYQKTWIFRGALLAYCGCITLGKSIAIITKLQLITIIALLLVIELFIFSKVLKQGSSLRMWCCFAIATIVIYPFGINNYSLASSLLCYGFLVYSILLFASNNDSGIKR